MNLSSFKFPKVITFAILSIIAAAIFMRAEGIGYSHFQGDEINTVTFLYGMDQGVWEYLMEQKRGPMQYVINLLNVGIFGYHSEIQIRLPYLIFGVLAIYTVYKLSRKIFDNQTALIASLLIAVNGLFLAFSRITQYQSFMYFLVPLGVYLFIKGIKDQKNNTKLVLSALLMSLALLAHYDTLSVIPFFVVGFVGYYLRLMKFDKSSDNSLDIGQIFTWLKTNKQILKELLIRSTIFFAVFLIPALAYYIPFYTHSAFDDGTSGYLSNRLFGGGFMPRTEHTLRLITLYVPKFHLYTIFVLGIVGMLFSYKKIGEFKFWKLKINKNLMKSAFIFLVLLVLFASIFSLYPIKPRTSSLLVIGSSISIAFLMTFYRSIRWELAALATWFLGTYSFYFFIMNDPRTHVYVSILPLMVLAAYGFTKLYNSIDISAFKHSLMALFLGSIFFISGLNWAIFVDKSPEYPWWDKDFMGQPIYRIGRVYHQKIEGVFGFNQYRGFEQIADLYSQGCLIGSFNSNEKDSITYFYMNENQKQLDELHLLTDADNLILVEGPHSWVYFSPNKVPGNYSLIHEIESKGYVVSRVYGKNDVYPDGRLLCLD